MKKFISNISNTTASAVNSAVKQIDKTLDKTLVQQEQQAKAAQLPFDSTQFLRLPVDSAIKLRWYDKADVASLTRQHVREKHMLLDTITALKKVMIRAGFTDASLEEEARRLVAAAEAVRLADHGTESVLLLAVQAELEQITAAHQSLAALNQQLQVEVQQLRDRAQAPDAMDGREVASTLSPAAAGAQVADEHAHEQETLFSAVPDASEAAADGGSLPPAVLVTELMAKYAALESATAAAAQAAAEVKLQELLLAQSATAGHQMQRQQQQLAQTNANGHDQQQANSVQQGKQPAALPDHAAAKASEPPLQPSPAADQVPAAVVQRYREFILQLEERCRSAERSSSLSAARVASLEESLAAAQQALAAAQQRGAQQAAAAKQQLSQLEERLRAAEAAAAAAAATPSPAAGSGVSEGQLAQAQQMMAASRTQVQGLERRLAAAESREAQLMAELRSAEAAAAERDAAVAAAAALQERLGELGADMSQLEHHKQRAVSLEVAKAALEGQLSSLAGEVAVMECRLREVTAQGAAATAAAELAAAAAAKAQAAVAEQVAARLAAAGHTRSLWPPAARQEVEALEQQVHTLQDQVQQVQQQLQDTRQHVQDEHRAHAQLKHKLADAQSKLIQVESQTQLQISELQAALQEGQTEVAELQDALQQAEQQLKAERAERSSVDLRNHPLLSSSSRSSSGIIHSSLGATRSSSGIMSTSLLAGGSNSTPRASAQFTGRGKWQEQNKIGGGSLYGVADATVAAAAVVPAVAHEALSGVDVVYLKNVVLKFLEAVMAGRAAERDALLPAVAAVLHATPAEFAAMRKVLAATAPPATQVMSMFGKLAQLTS